tara:strand:- start:2071 stop:2991 length:921 start_codon:yes stop_codon:yes gene_type:complete
MENNKEEINLIELLKVIWDGKYIISFITLAASVIAIIYSLSLSDIYRSQASLAPVGMESENSSGLANQLGGLAGLAGVSIGGNAGSKITIGLEVMQSRRFFNLIATKYDIVKPLMASKDWDRVNNKVVYDEDIYDSKLNKWVREPSPPKGSEPSLQEAHREFSSIFAVIPDKKTGIINLSIEHHSPYIAKQWLDLIIFEINNLSRLDDMKQAEKSIDYLKDEIKVTNLNEIKEGISELIQSQVEKIMLAKVTPEYLFKIIDPPYIAEIKQGPSRSLICILGFILGFILGVLSVIIRHFTSTNKSQT